MSSSSFLVHFSSATIVSMPIMCGSVPPLYSLPVNLYLSIDSRCCAENIKNFDEGGLCEMHGRGKNVGRGFGS